MPLEINRPTLRQDAGADGSRLALNGDGSLYFPRIVRTSVTGGPKATNRRDKEGKVPFYTRKKHVVHFEYRDFEVDVYKCFRGATHCGIEHRPRSSKCDKCNETIVPVLVFLIFVDESNIGIECASEEEACEIAKAYIDDKFEEDDEEQDPDVEETDDPEEDLRGADERNATRDPIPPPPPPGSADPLPGNIIHQMRKLKWVERAIAIMNSARDRSPSPRR